MTTLYRADDRNLLRSVLSAEGVHLRPGAVLDELTAEQAHAKPQGLPHSIAEIVAHMCYWQEWFNGCAIGGFTGIAEHAVDGWPFPRGNAQQPSSGPDHYDPSVDWPVATTGRDDYLVRRQTAGIFLSNFRLSLNFVASIRRSLFFRTSSPD
jgi:hypothetical protein